MFHRYVTEQTFHRYVTEQTFHRYVTEQMFHRYVTEQMFHRYVTEQMFRRYVLDSGSLDYFTLILQLWNYCMLPTVCILSMTQTDVCFASDWKMMLCHMAADFLPMNPIRQSEEKNRWQHDIMNVISLHFLNVHETLVIDKIVDLLDWIHVLRECL